MDGWVLIFQLDAMECFHTLLIIEMIESGQLGIPGGLDERREER